MNNSAGDQEETSREDFTREVIANWVLWEYRTLCHMKKVGKEVEDSRNHMHGGIEGQAYL